MSEWEREVAIYADFEAQTRESEKTRFDEYYEDQMRRRDELTALHTRLEAESAKKKAAKAAEGLPAVTSSEETATLDEKKAEDRWRLQKKKIRQVARRGTGRKPSGIRERIQEECDRENALAAERQRNEAERSGRAHTAQQGRRSRIDSNNNPAVAGTGDDEAGDDEDGERSSGSEYNAREDVDEDAAEAGSETGQDSDDEVLEAGEALRLGDDRCQRCRGHHWRCVARPTQGCRRCRGLKRSCTLSTHGRARKRLREEAERAPRSAAAGPSRLAPEYVDMRVDLSDDESLTAVGRALQTAARDLREYERMGAFLAREAERSRREVQEAFRLLLQEQDARKKDKGKERKKSKKGL